MPISNSWRQRGFLVCIAALMASGAVFLYGQAVGPRLESVQLDPETNSITLRFNRVPDTNFVSNGLTLRPPLAVRSSWQGSALHLFPLEGLPSSGALLIEGKTGTTAPFAATVNLPHQAVIVVADGIPFIDGSPLAGITHVTDMSVAKNAAVFSVEHDGQKEVWFYQTGTLQKISSTADGWDIRQAILSADGTHVLIHQLRPTQLASVAAVRLWTWDPTVKKLEPFWFQGSLPDGMWSTPEGAGVILREAGRMAYVPFAPQTNGEMTFLGKYDRLLSISQDGSTILFGTYSQEHLVLSAVTVGKPAEEILLPGQEVEEASLSPDGGTVYMLARPQNSTEDPSTPRQIFSYLRMNHVIAQLTEDSLWSIAEMALAPNGIEMVLARRRPVEGAVADNLVTLELHTKQLTPLTGASSLQILRWIQVP